MVRHVVLLMMLGALARTTPGSAQSYATDRGAVTLGGAARISRFRDIGSDASTTVIEVNPRLGYFVLPGLLVSANLQYAHYSSDAGNSSNYGIGPGVTYFFRHRETKLNPFLSARTLYVHQKSSANGFPGITDDSFTWLGSAGAALFVGRSVGVTGEVFYTRMRITSNFGGTSQRNSAEEFGTLFGLSVFLF